MAPTPSTQRVSGTRQDTFVLRVQIGDDDWGVWDKKTGGALDSDDIKYFPGGMLPPISLGGKRTTDNVTLQRLYDRNDDHGRIGTLLALVGKGRVVVSQKPLDVDGHEYGSKSIHYDGILKRVMIPDVDSESTSASLIEIELTVHGYPTAV